MATDKEPVTPPPPVTPTQVTPTPETKSIEKPVEAKCPKKCEDDWGWGMESIEDKAKYDRCCKGEE